MKKIFFAVMWVFVLLFFYSVKSYNNNVTYAAQLIDEYTHLELQSVEVNDNLIITDDYIVTIEHNNVFVEEEPCHDEHECEHHEHEHNHYFHYQDPDSYLIELREKQKEYYMTVNEEIIAELELDIPSENISYSYFAPFIQIVFDNYEEYELSNLDINQLLYNEEINTVYVNNGIQYKEVAVTRPGGYSNAYDFNDALLDVGVDNNKYQGSGVRVGVIEIGLPNNLFGISSSQITINSNSSTYYDYTAERHAEVVSNIITGSYGISRNSHLYFSSIGYIYQNSYLYDSLNWMISYPQSVNVVNMSLGVSSGIYTSVSRLLDYLTINTRTLFVVSSGNSGKNYNSNEVGNGMNVVSVGSSNQQKRLSFFSDAGVASYLHDKIIKPTLLAPGERLYNLGNIDNRYLDFVNKMNETNDGHSGTSFSAPIVTGIVALLMEEYDFLKLEPWTLHSLLISSTTKIYGQNTEYDNLAGFGLVNYTNARNILYNNNFFTIYKSKYTSPNSASYYSGYLTVPAGETVKMKVVMMMPQSKPTYIDGTQETPVYSDYIISLVESTSSPDLVVAIKKANYYYLTYTNNTSSSKSLYIKVKLNGTFKSNNTEYGSVTFDGRGIHRHWYKIFVSADDLTHTFACNCGQTDTSSHYIDLNYGSYVCAGCGRKLDPSRPWPVIS